MSDRDNLLVQKVFRRIYLKKEYQKLFLPDLYYLQFIQVLEIFQAQFEGVHGEGKEEDLVELQTIKDKLTEITRLYNLTTEKFTSLLGQLKCAESTVLLEDSHKNIDNCKIFLNNTWISFSQEVDLLGRDVYNIKILSKIDDSLDSLRIKVEVVTLNLNNLKYSTLVSEVKRFLKCTYQTALSFIQKKYAYIKHFFPKSLTVVSLYTMPRKNNRSTLKNESSSDEIPYECNESVDEDKKSFDFLDCLNVDICTCNAPQIPEATDNVCSIPSSESTRGQQIDENKITEEYEDQRSKRKIVLQQVMGDLLTQSREVARIDNEIFMREAKHELQDECYLRQKRKIEEDESLNETEKLEKIKLMDCLIAQKNKKLKDETRALKKKRQDICKQSRCNLKQLKQLIKIFCLEHRRMIDYLEKFKLKALCPADIEQKIDILQRNFNCEMDRIEEFNDKIANLYEANEDISDQSTESGTSSSCSKSSTSKEAEILQVVDVKNDNDMYIKHVVGKALVQGLAEITIHQPTDPIYFLANYLLHYRYNELSNLKKQVAFEDLLIERDRYSKVIKKDPAICNPCQGEDQDPCK